MLGDDVVAGRNTRVSLGVDRRYKTLQASATYAYTRGGAVARGLNLNAPVNGVRPDPQFGNIIEVVSDASSRQHQLQANLTVNQGALFPLPKSAPRINFKRITLFLNYTLARLRNNTDGAFSVAPTRRSRRSSGARRTTTCAPHQPQSQQPDHQEPERSAST